MEKLSDALLITLSIVTISKVKGVEFKSIFLTRGKLRLAISIGLLSFIGFSLVFYYQASISNLPFAQYRSSIPWILMFILSNGLMEELHFRGLFLNKFRPFLGETLSNFCSALIFALAHLSVGYVSDIFSFLAITFWLGLGLGFVIQKTDTLWGAVLIHAGADLIVIRGIVASI